MFPMIATVVRFVPVLPAQFLRRPGELAMHQIHWNSASFTVHNIRIPRFLGLAIEWEDAVRVESLMPSASFSSVVLCPHHGTSQGGPG